MAEFQMYIPLKDEYHPHTFKGIFDFELIYVEEDKENTDVIYMEYQMPCPLSNSDNWSVEINLKRNTIKGLGMKRQRQWIKYCLEWYRKTLDDEVLANKLFPYGKE